MVFHGGGTVLPPSDPQAVHAFVSSRDRLRACWQRVREQVQLALFDVRPWEVRRRWRLARRAREKAQGLLLLAGGLIFDDMERVLLIHRATPKLVQWETPGGKIDRGETPGEAARRELHEELGVSTELVEDLGAHDFEADGRRIRYALFAVRVADGAPQLSEPAFDQLRFFSWAELASMQDELSPNVRNIVALQLRGRLRRRPVEPAPALRPTA